MRSAIHAIDYVVLVGYPCPMAGVGLACFPMLLANTSGRELTVTAAYAVVTAVVGLAFVVAGRTPQGGRGAAAAVGAGAVVKD